MERLRAWSWGVWSLCRGEGREPIPMYRAVPQKMCTEGGKCWQQTWTFSLLRSAASDVKWSIFLRCKRTSSTKTSCPKSGSFLALTRTKKAEQTEWSVVQEMQRPSAERCSGKAEGPNWAQAKEAATKKGSHQSSGISDMLYKYFLDKKESPLV